MELLNIGDFLLSAGGFALLLGVFHKIGGIEKTLKDVDDRINALEAWRRGFLQNINIGE